MTIDWAPVVAVGVVTALAAVGIFGVFSLGVHAQSTADARVRNGQSPGLARLAGYGCFALAALLVICGLYLFLT